MKTPTRDEVEKALSCVQRWRVEEATNAIMALFDEPKVPRRWIVEEAPPMHTANIIEPEGEGPLNVNILRELKVPSMEALIQEFWWGRGMPAKGVERLPDGIRAVLKAIGIEPPK